MTADLPDLDELKRRHHGHKAPLDAQTAAVARFAASRIRTSYWPAWGVAAAVLCAVLLLPGVVGEDEPSPEPGYGAAGLSLGQMELPQRSDLLAIAGSSPSGMSASDLSASTTLPLGVPNLSQLSVTLIEDKETI